jgi:hypothetical protein
MPLRCLTSFGHREKEIHCIWPSHDRFRARGFLLERHPIEPRLECGFSVNVRLIHRGCRAWFSRSLAWTFHGPPLWALHIVVSTPRPPALLAPGPGTPCKRHRFDKSGGKFWQRRLCQTMAHPSLTARSLPAHLLGPPGASRPREVDRPSASSSRRAKRASGLPRRSSTLLHSRPLRSGGARSSRSVKQVAGSKCVACLRLVKPWAAAAPHGRFALQWKRRRAYSAWLLVDLACLGTSCKLSRSNGLNPQSRKDLPIASLTSNLQSRTTVLDDTSDLLMVAAWKVQPVAHLASFVAVFTHTHTPSSQTLLRMRVYPTGEQNGKGRQLRGPG